jgi:hypothetical protein
LNSWLDRESALRDIARRQLFFVGGAPRSGTTWLQMLLDSHPQVSCGGEGLFGKNLAEPLDQLVSDRRTALEAKNRGVFRQTGGYRLPEQDDADTLLGTAILLALQRQSAGKPCLAIGEKTPENVFLFPRLKRLFPDAKLIALARDPRDVLTSAWHFFVETKTEGNPAAAKAAYVRAALPSLNQGARTMLALAEQDPAACRIVTYERLNAAPEPTAVELFRFLKVSAEAAITADCVARTSFAALSGGRQAGVAQDGAFFRKGVVGDWRSTLPPEVNALILDELGWMFPRFGWEP